MLAAELHAFGICGRFTLNADAHEIADVQVLLIKWISLNGCSRTVTMQPNAGRLVLAVRSR
jgi:hypothetical protein